MKTKAFDGKLYREAFRQLAPMGLMFFILSVVAMILLVTERVKIHMYGPEYYLPSEVMPLGAVFAFLATLCLCLTAFQFTTQRSASDLYFSMTQSRLCLFTAFYGAVVTWQLVLIFGSAVLTGVAASSFPDYFVFSWAALLEYAGMIFSVTLYIASFFALAAAFSGTVIGHLSLTLTLLFIPRIAVYMMITMVASVGVLVTEALCWPFSRINLFTNLCFSSLDNYGSYREMLSFSDALTGGVHANLTALLYTLGAGLLWTVVAALCFRKRPAEAAENAVFSPRMRTAMRISLAFIACLIPIEALNELRLYGGTSHSAMSLFSAVAAALLIFFTTELLLTRSFHSLKKALPSLLILLLVCTLAFGGVVLGDKIARSYLPQAEDLAYVRLVEGYGERYELNEKIAAMQWTDPEVKAILCRSLQRRTDAFDPDFEYEYGHDAAVMQVAFQSGLFERYRCVNITYEDIRALGKALRNNEEFRRTCLDLPDEDALVSVVFYVENGPVSALPEEDSLLIYRSLREEMREADFEILYREYFYPWQYQHEPGAPQERAPSAGHLRVAAIIDDPLGDVFTVRVPADYPKTYALCLSLSEAAGIANRGDLLSALARLASAADDQAGATLWIRARDESGFSYDERLLYGDIHQLGVYISPEPSLHLDRSSLTQLQEFLASEEMQRMPADDPRATFQVSLYDYSVYPGEESEEHSEKSVQAGFHAMTLSQELIDWLQELGE